MNSPEDATQVLGKFLFMLLPFVTVHGVACFLERLGGNPSFFRDLAKGETAATEVKRRWNAEGARNAPIAKGLRKNNFAELALRFGSDLADPIEQNHRNS